MIRIMAFVPAHSMIEARTALSLYEMGLHRTFQVDGAFTEVQVDLDAIYTGAYVGSHCWNAVKRARGGEFDYCLRIDADMSWNTSWLEHFIRGALIADAHTQYRINPGARPFLAGGVYLCRVNPANPNDPYPLVVDVHDHPDDASFVAWARACWNTGATVPVRRVAGGFQLWNKALLDNLRAENFATSPDLGEDYRVCDRVRDLGGQVVGVWPCQAAQIYHGHGPFPPAFDGFFDEELRGIPELRQGIASEQYRKTSDWKPIAWKA